jgi:tRNA-dihydrouridine synthase 1
VISNGNVRTYDDVVNNMRITNADGIMSGEAILANPSLFSQRTPDPFDHCDE